MIELIIENYKSYINGITEDGEWSVIMFLT